VEGLAFKFFWVTGGTDGIRVAYAKLTLLGGFVDFAGPGSFQRFIFAYYYYVLGLFTLATVIMWVIVHSPFGKALQAIRDNETRASFVGISVRRYRWIAFVISGAFTGLAGTLWVPLNGLTTPDVLYWPFSGEIVFMSVLGGFPHVRWAHRRCGGLQTISRPPRSRARNTGSCCSAWCSWPWSCSCRPGSWGRRRGLSAGSRGDAMSLLETIHLKKYFGDTHAVDDVNLAIEEGEFVSLVVPTVPARPRSATS